MGLIHDSGYYLPSKLGLVFLEYLYDVMGKNGFETILNQANLKDLVSDIPQKNFELDFEFTFISSISKTVMDIYGPRGGSGFLYRAGRDTFRKSLQDFGVFRVVNEDEFESLSVDKKLKLGLNMFVSVSNRICDQITTLSESADRHNLSIHRCPSCWGWQNEVKPICSFSSGLIQECINWTSGGNEFKVKENKCIAVGDEVCEFIIMKSS